jgi:hypothetical protein
MVCFVILSRFSLAPAGDRIGGSKSGGNPTLALLSIKLTENMFVLSKPGFVGFNQINLSYAIDN